MIYARDVSSSVNEKECEKLAQLAEGKVVLEMGAWLGRSTIALASTAERVYSVDWHQGDKHVGTRATYDEYIDNLARYGVQDKVEVYVGRFLDIVPGLSRIFDLVFVDGQHDAESIKIDGKLALEAVKLSGGILAFHDYGSIFHPIADFVDDLQHWSGATLYVVKKLAVLTDLRL